MRLGWAAKIATSRVSSTSSMTYANMSCFHWVCGETIAVLYSQISPCTLVHPIHTRSWGPQHHTHCSSVHVVRLSRNLATHVIVCSMIVLHVVWKMTQWIIYNYMKILLYSVYIYIYIYMVTPPPRAYLQEGVYHIYIFIFIFQNVAHAKTTVNTSVFWIHYM